MATGKKFYWLKLSRDFFKRHDIKIIKSQKNGKDYLIFYLTLLAESVDHAGHLRFNELIPYDDEMLSIITDTDIDIVKSAVKLLCSLGLMEFLDDETIYMTELQKMVGYETDWAKKKREYREHKEIKSADNVPKLSPPSPHNVRQEIDKEIEKDKEILKEKDKKEKTVATRSPSFKKPTMEEIYNYCKERKNNIDSSAFYDFYESKNWFIGKNKMKDWKAAVRTWEKRDSGNKKINARPDAKPDWLDEYVQQNGGN
jgi:predicted phage replisome organizer